MGCSFSSHKVKYADKKSSHNIHVSSCGNMKVNEGQHGERVNNAEESFLYDVNISCHENQIDWVQTHLLPVLEEKLKLRCFLFERDSPTGISQSQIIEESIKHSKQIIICFSQDYLLSSWKQYEVLMAHHTDPTGFKRTFIPILLDGCELPTRYSGFSVLRWPPQDGSEYKSRMRTKFFWTNLLRTLGIRAEQSVEDLFPSGS
ncbi:unnamed protein product [Clavelina lepadiformis]|uniref:TIR domain-containing protein n=1 Tax=Clavelina lepadiformis TaxID=159417 RepID=A0ABP0FU93_CLALP